MPLSVPSPLYRASATLYKSWSYDPDLRLKAAPNPYETPVDPQSLLMKVRRQQQGYQGML